ncbi:MAG: hypothetical protein ACK5LE_02710 [Alphaproteobacteria bacterium]
MPFIIALCIIFILVFVALWLALKGEKSKKKFNAIWAILAVFVASYFFWSYAGFASKDAFPLQTSAMTKEQLPNGKLVSHKAKIIADHRTEPPKAVVQQQAPTSAPHGDQAPNIDQMLAMADNLEKGLIEGSKDPSNWALLARTREFQGQNDQAAQALLSGYQAFLDNAEVQASYKAEMGEFIARVNYDGQHLGALQQIIGAQ